MLHDLVCSEPCAVFCSPPWLCVCVCVCLCGRIQICDWACAFVQGCPWLVCFSHSIRRPLFQITVRACEFRLRLYVGVHVCVCPWTWVGTCVCMPAHNLAWTQRFEWSPALTDRAVVPEWRDWPSIAYRTSLQYTLLTPCLFSLLPLLNPLVPSLLSLPPIPCCLAPRARRPWRCTHALPHCVKLCLLVCVWVCVHMRECEYGNACSRACTWVCAAEDLWTKEATICLPFLPWQ